MAQSFSWRRVLVEGAVIVGSILLPFAIDAAWEDRQQQALTNRRGLALHRTVLRRHNGCPRPHAGAHA